MPASVSGEYLLKGAVYALEQCGLLLRDANLLYRGGSHASALALAAFAREELGQWTILLDLRDKVMGGEYLTIEEVNARCIDHVRKQAAGMKSLTMRAHRNSGLGKVLNTRTTAEPGSVEGKAARDQIEELDRQKQRRVPDDRHKQRMAALYVDAISIDHWNRPSKAISQTGAYEFICDAVNDYSLQYSQRYTELKFIEATHPELFHALQDWQDRPELPPPEWPPFPVGVAARKE
jgi:AbiV family abortive infection protein